MKSQGRQIVRVKIASSMKKVIVSGGLAREHSAIIVEEDVLPPFVLPPLPPLLLLPMPLDVSSPHIHKGVSVAWFIGLYGRGIGMRDSMAEELV